MAPRIPAADCPFALLVRIAALAAFVVLAARGQDTAPAAAEGYERTLREERVRHADQVRKLSDEADRLRVAVEAARGRLNEAEARRTSLRKLANEAEGAAAEAQGQLAAARAMLRSIHETLFRAVERLARSPIGGAPPAREIAHEGAPLARRIRLLFQFLDRELTAARSVAVSTRERQGELGHEVRLGALATFFVPAAGGPAIVEPSGRELPGPVGAALREVIRQSSKRGARGSLVAVPWWGGS